ncbi:hypothetical protein QYM36_018495, partial [Artemia franciscana]
MRITGEFERYTSLVKQIAGTENLFLGIDILKQQAFEQGLHNGIRRFIRERGACPETSRPGITPIHTGAVEMTIQTSMLGRITVPQIEGISGEDILEDFRLQVSITAETEGIATEGTLDKIFKKVCYLVPIMIQFRIIVTRSTLEFWTSHRYHVPKECLDHGGIQMVAIIDRQQFDTETKVVYVDNTRSTLEFWTSHRYQVPKECLDHGGIQMVAIIDRQQFDTERKVVYVVNTRNTLEFWTSHRYHVPKECLDHGGIQIVAIIDRQQFDTERKVVYVDNTRSTLEFWTSHRYHVPKECLDHGGIQMVAIIDRQQFDTETKVVYVDN